jgi:uncharacterized protein
MKKIYLFLLAIILLFTLNVHASTNTKERTADNNYGVTKETDYQSRLNSIMKTKYVDASEKIYDFSDILTDDEEQQLKTLIDNFYNKTKMDLVIVTDNLPYTNDNDNMVYAEDFYDYNDFGLGTKHYDGIVLFRNTYQLDPYYDMRLTGEAQIYYTPRIDDILDTIYSEIKNQQYYNAFKHFIELLDNYYETGIPSSMEGYTLDDTGHLVAPPEPPKEYKIPTLWMIIAGVLGTSIFTGVNIKKNKMVKHAYEANTFIDQNTINYTKRTDTFINSVVTHHTISSDSGGSGGGFSSHSGSSGFGHTGGGRHG